MLTQLLSSYLISTQLPTKLMEEMVVEFKIKGWQGKTML